MRAAGESFLLLLYLFLAVSLLLLTDMTFGGENLIVSLKENVICCDPNSVMSF
jgi:hypothetical protein